MPLHAATLFVDVGLHIFILFTFLALFFFLYISKIERSAFGDEFQDLIQDNLPTLLATADQKSSGAVKQGLRSVPDFLAFLKQSYSRPDPVVQTYNNWLALVAFSISAVLLTMIVGGIAVRNSGCLVGTLERIPLKKLLAKNGVTFLLVGIIEGLFFVLIAKKYIPAKPSQLVQDILSRLKQNLA